MPLLPETFLREFLLPLIAGGELHVGRPLDAEDLVRLEAELVSPTEESVAIESARADLAAALWLYPVPTELDRPTLELAAALHNLLFLSHPGARRWYLRQSSIEQVLAFSGRCLEQAPAPAGGAELVARHTLLGMLPELHRQDVEVRFWAGKRTYLGQEPPTRLTRWKSVRGVREHRQHVRWIDTELSDGQKQLLEHLLRHSPLTDLLAPARAYPTFEWMPVARYLADPLVCRLVCHFYLERGLERVGAPLAEAFWRLVDTADLKFPAPEGSQWALELVGGLVVYLYAVTALTGAGEPAFDTREPTSSLPVVLMAAVRCGLLPDAERVGGAAVHGKLLEWAAEPVGPLGATSDDLVHRLEAALAA